MPKMPSNQPPAQTPGMGYSSTNTNLDYSNAHQPTQMQGMGYSSGLDYSSGNFNGSFAVNNQSFNVDQNNGPSVLGAASATAGTQHEDGAPPKPAQPNMFKMQRGRNLKTSYVDIFKQNGSKSTAGPGAAPVSEKVPVSSPPQMNFFIPPPVLDPNAPVDFLTPGGAPVQIGEQQ